MCNWIILFDGKHLIFSCAWERYQHSTTIPVVTGGNCHWPFSAEKNNFVVVLLQFLSVFCEWFPPPIEEHSFSSRCVMCGLGLAKLKDLKISSRNGRKLWESVKAESEDMKSDHAALRPWCKSHPSSSVFLVIRIPCNGPFMNLM